MECTQGYFAPTVPSRLDWRVILRVRVSASLGVFGHGKRAMGNGRKEWRQGPQFMIPFMMS